MTAPTSPSDLAALAGELREWAGTICNQYVLVLPGDALGGVVGRASASERLHRAADALEAAEQQERDSQERVDGYAILQAQDIDNLTARANRAEAERDEAMRHLEAVLGFVDVVSQTIAVIAARAFLDRIKGDEVSAYPEGRAFLAESPSE